MGCIETKPTRALRDFLEHDISIKDIISFRQHLISEHYDVGTSIIGHGKRGELRKAVHKATKQVRAVKMIPRKNMDAEHFRKEANILRNVDHYNIARTFDIFQDNKNFYIVSELCSGVELFEKIQKNGVMSEGFAAKVMRDLLSAVSYMHKCGIIHRNIKPESLRFANEAEDAPLKITNFALADIFTIDDPKKEFLGTVDYMAPEMIDGLYNTSVDIWACGVIMHIMLSGTPPFTGKTQDEIIKAIKEKPLTFEGEVWAEVSNEAKDLLSKLLKKDLGERIHSEAALQHEWFKKKLGDQKSSLKTSKIVIGNMTKYRIQKKIQQAVWLFMIYYIGCQEEKEKMMEEFRAMDKDHDGQLSREELMAGVKNAMSIFANSSLVSSTFEKLDRNHSGFIEYTEFVAAVVDRKIMLSKENLETTFKMLDTDHSGTISMQELKEAFGGEQILYGDEHWKKLIEEGDANGDGLIDFQEFQDLMLQMKK